MHILHVLHNSITLSNRDHTQCIATGVTQGGTTAAANASPLSGSPSRRMRSRNECRCGEVYSPVRSPCARSALSAIAATLPFPFVPAT